MSRTVPEGVRAAVLERCQFRCERCGIRMLQGLHMSHRQPRGMGGALTRKVVPHSRLANINALCARCHLGHVESNPAVAADEGWKVRRGMEPEDVPIRSWWGWTYLTNDGGYVPYPGSDATPPPESEPSLE